MSGTAATGLPSTAVMMSPSTMPTSARASGPSENTRSGSPRQILRTRAPSATRSKSAPSTPERMSTSLWRISPRRTCECINDSSATIWLVRSSSSARSVTPGSSGSYLCRIASQSTPCSFGS